MSVVSVVSVKRPYHTPNRQKAWSWIGKLYQNGNKKMQLQKVNLKKIGKRYEAKIRFGRHE